MIRTLDSILMGMGGGFQTLSEEMEEMGQKQPRISRDGQHLTALWCGLHRRPSTYAQQQCVVWAQVNKPQTNREEVRMTLDGWTDSQGEAR